MEKSIGNVLNLSSSFSWKISDFFSLPTKIRDCYSSPQFEFANITWRLDLYPNGNETENAGWLAVCLTMVNLAYSYPENVIKYALSIKDKLGNNYVELKKRKFPLHGTSFGKLKFLELSKLLEEKNKLASEDVLTISCTLSWEHSFGKNAQGASNSHVYYSSRHVASVKLWEPLARNLKDSLLNEKDCDIIIRVKEREFSAHKMILKSRSTVFAAMFEHDMEENRTGVVEIKDTEPHDFQDLLIFIYSGEVQKLSVGNVRELYALADKYDFQDLKQECLKFMETHLSVDTICKDLILAKKYNEVEMEELAKIFLSKNLSFVFNTHEWEMFETDHPSLVIKVLKSIFIDKEYNDKKNVKWVE